MLSTLLSTREIQIKVTMRYHLTPVRMAIVKHSTKNQGWRRCGEMRTLLHWCWKVDWEQPLWRQCVRVLSHFSRVRLFLAPLSPGKTTGVGCHALLQGIFPTQGLNPSLSCFLCWRVDSLPLGPPGKPMETVQRCLKQWKWGEKYNIPVDLKKYSQPKSGEPCFIRWEFLGLQAQETHVK